MIVNERVSTLGWPLNWDMRDSTLGWHVERVSTRESAYQLAVRCRPQSLDDLAD